MEKFIVFKITVLKYIFYFVLRNLTPATWVNRKQLLNIASFENTTILNPRNGGIL